ncbi:MAG: HAMP domain-containing histidine kinase [Bacteroidales bacterium]|nr:HAMP domain-containing histidine kinase [Bacteroidales bacterium]
MFDLQVNSSDADGNFQINSWNKGGNDMNLKNHDILNCPSILAGMSHEMRTYMNSIVAFTFLMKEKCFNNQEGDEFSTQILKSCDQLIGLFDSFLESAIIDTTDTNVSFKKCKLDNTLDDLFSEFRETIKRENNNELEFLTEFQISDYPEVYIDKYRISRIIRCLFQNSIKNTKSGYIKIGYYFRDDNLTVYVLDSGQSYFKCKEFIDSDDINESVARYNDAFAAINIVLAKKLIKMMGGNIWIECNGLAGAGIYFSVPASMVEKSDVNSDLYLNSMIAI